MDLLLLSLVKYHSLIHLLLSKVYFRFRYLDLLKVLIHSLYYFLTSISKTNMSQSLCPSEWHFGHSWSHICSDCSRSFKLIDFCTNWKPICDFLLVTGLISNRFQDIAPRTWKAPHPSFWASWDPNSRVIKLTTLKVETTRRKPHDLSLGCFATIHLRQRRHTTIGELCNAFASFGYK